MKRDYIRDFSGFLSEGYNPNPTPAEQELVIAMKNLHAAQLELQKMEMNFVENPAASRYGLRQTIVNQIKKIKKLEDYVTQGYRKAGIQDFLM